MCGVFGWVSKNGGRVDLKTLRRIAVVTESRGPHAWGMAWLDRDGELHMYKQTGRISKNLDMLRMARNAVALIGHTRWEIRAITETIIRTRVLTGGMFTTDAFPPIVPSFRTMG